MIEKDIKTLIQMIKSHYSFLSTREKKEFERIMRINPPLNNQ